MESSARARRDVDRAARGEIGEIVVGFTQTVGGSLLPEGIRSYRKQHPGIAIDLREVMSTDRPTDLLMRDDIDVSLGHYPTSEPVFIRSELIFSEPYSLVALPADHRLAAKRTVALGDLCQERIIAGPASNPSAEEDAQLAQDVANAAGTSSPPELMHTSNAVTRLVLVATGVGVTLLLGSGPRITHPGIVYRPLVGSRQTIKLYASRRVAERAPHVLSFIENLLTLGRAASAAIPR
jgi:DNA-binding transcriptional LysR family regulator